MHHLTASRRIPAALIAGWLIISLAVLLIVALAFPGGGSSGLGLRFALIEALSLILWSSGAVYVLVFADGHDSNQRLGGVAPALLLLTVSYVGLSFACLLVHRFVAQGGLADRGIWIFQIARTAFAAMVIILLDVARAGAASGLAFDHRLAMSPRQLHDLIVGHEPADLAQRFPDLATALKRLRDGLLHSLNTSTDLARNQDYQALSRHIEQCCADLAKLEALDDDQTALSQPLTDTINNLTSKVKLLAAQRVVR